MIEAQKFLWCEAFQEQARGEGWELEPVANHYGLTIVPRFGHPSFLTDIQAVRAVAIHAIFGASPLHQLALRIEHQTHRMFYDHGGYSRYTTPRTAEKKFS